MATPRDSVEEAGFRIESEGYDLIRGNGMIIFGDRTAGRSYTKYDGAGQYEKLLVFGCRGETEHLMIETQTPESVMRWLLQGLT